jgi:hypothetical protein
MPLYYFSFENGHRIRDPLGEEFPDDEAAIQMACQIAADLGRAKPNPGSLRVVVRDTNDKPVGEVPLQVRRSAECEFGAGGEATAKGPVRS